MLPLIFLAESGLDLELALLLDDRPLEDGFLVLSCGLVLEESWLGGALEAPPLVFLTVSGLLFGERWTEPEVVFFVILKKPDLLEEVFLLLVREVIPLVVEDEMVARELSEEQETRGTGELLKLLEAANMEAAEEEPVTLPMSDMPEERDGLDTNRSAGSSRDESPNSALLLRGSSQSLTFK